MPAGGTLSSLGSSFEELIRGANESREAVSQLRGELNNVRQTTTQNAQAIAAVIDALTNGMAGIQQEVTKVVQGINNLSSASARNRQTIQQESATMDDLWAAYRKMGVEVKNLEVNLDTLNFSEKEMNKVVQLGTQYNRERSDSYTALSQKYRAIKILIDQMTVAERENTESGRNLVATAREMYEQMNLLQQRTGKYQLQVGDYSKAMTGLNIATNQVVRELPVLANGVSMFAIAISNNIPILVDNIVQVRRSIDAQKALKKELLENAAAYEAEGNAAAAAAARQSAAGIKTTSVIAALGKAVFSWQTALVLVLTVLPGLIRNIEQKKKAQKEEAEAQEKVNEETKAAKEEMQSLDDIYRDIKSSIEGEVTELKTLATILDDTNRSWKDRVDAGKRLKQIFDEELSGFSAEQIAMGEAKTAMQNLTTEIYNQAKARAQLTKITELTQKIIALEGDEQLYGNWRVGEKTVREYAEALDEANAAGKRLQIGAVEREYVDKYRSIVGEMKGLQSQIDALVDQIRPEDLLTDENRRGAKGKSGKAQIADYYNDALRALIDGMDNTLYQEINLLDLAWKEEQETYEKHRMELLRIQRDGNAKERQEATTQLENLHFALLTEERNYVNERKRLIQEMLDSYREEVADEGDVVAAEQKVIATGLNAEKKLREAAAYKIYEISERSAADKEALDEAIRDSERKYWEDYLAALREAGVLTIEEYNTIMSNLAKAAKQNEDRAKRGRRGRMYGGIVEAVLAQTSRFGEKDKYGIDVIKDEYKEFVTAIDSALKTSMGFMDEWMDKRLEMAKIAVEAAEREVAAAQKVLDFEMEARANGYANRVETARKELDLERENHRKALEEQRRLQEQQLLLDSISQTSSLITATANIWEAMTKGTGIFGPGLAIAATALLWGSFAASKIKAKQLAGLQAEQYGEGTVELLEGGSHASGHDIDLGVKKDGTRRRAEGGEFFAVINKRNSRRYRSIIPDVINSFNDGTFGDKYQKANEAMGNFALGVMAGNSPTDVSALERDVRAIREQGDEHRYVDMKGNTIIRYKNLTRKINRS